VSTKAVVLFRALMLKGKVDKAWTVLRRARVEGHVLSGLEQEETFNSNLTVMQRSICPQQLEHDIQQLEYLLSLTRFRGAVAEELTKRRELYDEALGWLEEFEEDVLETVEAHTIGCTPLEEFPAHLRTRIAASYHRDILPAIEPASPEPALREIDWGTVEAQFWAQGYAVVDDVLHAEHYEHLLRFATEASIFTRVDFPYIGAYIPRIATPLLESLSKELPNRMPGVFRKSPLQMMWIYKHVRPKGLQMYADSSTRPQWKKRYSNESEPQEGSTTHNDMSTVNVNLMLSRNGSKLQGGGLQIFLCNPVGDREGVDIENSEIMDYLVSGCPNVTVAYKPNRAVIWASTLYHRTERFLFKPEFLDSRGFLTLLYGVPRSVKEVVALSPEHVRDSFTAVMQRTAEPIGELGVSLTPGDDEGGEGDGGEEEGEFEEEEEYDIDRGIKANTGLNRQRQRREL